MIIPQEGQMNYKDLDEIAVYYMFISACLTEEERSKLKIGWEEKGGFKKVSWWRFVMENTKIEIMLN